MLNNNHPVLVQHYHLELEVPLQRRSDPLSLHSTNSQSKLFLLLHYSHQSHQSQYYDKSVLLFSRTPITHFTPMSPLLQHLLQS